MTSTDARSHGPVSPAGALRLAATAEATERPAAPREPLPPAMPAKPAKHSAFIPLLLCVLTLAGWFTGQMFEAYSLRQQLQQSLLSQQAGVDEATRLRQSLDALAADTQRMANAGNANAALLVAELNKRGVTIQVPVEAATGTPPQR